MRSLLLCLIVMMWSRDATAAEISAMRTNSASDVVPLWDCWFNTYPAPLTVVNLVLGYNNTQDFEITVPDSPENQLSPVQFNGYQPFIFKPGINHFSIVLPDTRKVLGDATAQITWALGDKLVAIDASMLVEAERCDIKFQGACPTWIDGFCDDTLYCNGQESCFTAVSAYRQMAVNVMGRCQPPLEGVRCSVSEVCNETLRACVLAAPPPPPTPSVVPMLNCWQYVNGTAMHVQLVLDCNNTGSVPVSRGITLSADTSNVKNNIQPDVYNTLQPTLFLPGLTRAAFTLIDTVDVLRSGSIVWSLTDQRLTISGADLTDQRMCASTRAPTSAPTGTPIGITVPPPAPTESTPLVSAPLYFDTNVSDDDVNVLPTQCSISNMDCTPYDSYCLGTTQCDLASGYCVLVDATYTPCATMGTHIRPGVEAVLQCVEHASQCVAVVLNCIKDKDCNDGFICNGQERCINSTCVSPVNQTVATVCDGYVNAICIEGVGCQPTDQMDSRTVYGIVLGVMGGVAIILFLVYLALGRTPTTATGSNTIDTKPKSG